MKICFVGLGSIGTRHLRNLSALIKSRGGTLEADALRSGARPLPPDVSALLRREYRDASDLPQDYDAAFICSPTSAHFGDIRRMAPHARNMFIEKPVFDAAHDPGDLGLREGGTHYVACPLRYNAVLQYIKNNIDCGRVFSVRCISSSYLPDWRPGQDYRATYSARRDMGGGVSIDLIHEWDYLSWLFGMPERVMSVIGKVSALEIDSDDLAVYIGRNRSTVFEVHLDYFGRKPIRKLELFMEDDAIEADILGGTVTYRRSGKTVSLKEERNAYQTRELEHFLDIVSGKCENDNTVQNAVNVLKTAKGEA